MLRTQPNFSVRGVGVGSVAVILVLGIGLFLVDGGDLRMADAFDLMTVREMGMMGGADMIVVRIGFGGLGVLMCGDGEVVGGLAVVFGSGKVEFVFALGDHGSLAFSQSCPVVSARRASINRMVARSTRCHAEGL